MVMATATAIRTTRKAFTCQSLIGSDNLPSLNLRKARMPHARSVDDIIVGQGLAGTMLAHFLLQAGRRVLVVDRAAADGSSRVAAGIYTPLAGKRAALLWRAAAVLDFIEVFYPALESELNARFYFPHPLLRIFKNEAHRAAWQRRREQDAYSCFLGAWLEEAEVAEAFRAPHGAVQVLRSGSVATKPLLDCYRRRLQAQDALMEADMVYEEISPGRDGLRWRNIEAERMVFCEGFRALGNPWFPALPLRPTHGDILTISIASDDALPIAHGEFFLVPVGGNRYRAGATYLRDTDDLRPRADGRRTIEEGLPSMLQLPFRVRSHEAGIRPTIIGHHPFAGVHPQLKSLCIANGYGSKGVLFAPYIAHLLTEHLLRKQPLPAELDIQQYFKEQT